MKKIFETGILLFAAFGFWGMIYPDLCFTRDVCEVYIVENDETPEQAEGGYADVRNGTVVAEDNEPDAGNETAVAEDQASVAGNETAVADGKTPVATKEKNGEMPPIDIFTRLCMAEPEQIRVKSKFFEVFITESKGKSNVVNER